MNDPSTSNYIQYVNDLGRIQTKSVLFEVGNHDTYFTVEGINEPFFILSVFENNLKKEGLGFVNLDNELMLSFINDSNVDLSNVPKTAFFNPLQKVVISYSQTYLKTLTSSVDPLVPQLVRDVDYKRPNEYLRYLIPQFRVDTFNAYNSYVNNKNYAMVMMHIDIFCSGESNGKSKMDTMSFPNTYDSQMQAVFDVQNEWDSPAEVGKVFMINGMFVRLMHIGRSFSGNAEKVRIVQNAYTNEWYFKFYSIDGYYIESKLSDHTPTPNGFYVLAQPFLGAQMCCEVSNISFDQQPVFPWSRVPQHSIFFYTEIEMIDDYGLLKYSDVNKKANNRLTGGFTVVPTNSPGMIGINFHAPWLTDAQNLNLNGIVITAFMKDAKIGHKVGHTKTATQISLLVTDALDVPQYPITGTKIIVMIRKLTQF